jgi:hypothetical protein
VPATPIGHNTTLRAFNREVESPERQSDAELLAAASSDPVAFGRFYDRYEAAVAGYFVRRTRIPEVAADLTAHRCVAMIDRDIHGKVVRTSLGG